MKKVIKTLFILIFGLITAIVLAVVIAPNFFKDKLIQTVKIEINKQIEGEVDFSDVEVTWWSTFPDVSLQLDDLKVTGYKPDSTIKDMFFAEELAFTFDFKSAWSQADSLEVKSFRVLRPDLFIYVDNNGKANYNVVATEEPTNASNSSGIKFDLAGYEIREGRIQYIDRTSGVTLAIAELNHTGDLTYEKDNVIWSGNLESADVDYTQSGMSYLSNGKLGFDGKLKLDLANGKYTFLENDIRLNALQLFLDGDITQSDDNINFNVDIKTRKNTFKSFLSVLPNMYSKDFDKIDVKGNLALVGSVDGTYNEAKNLFPRYSFNLDVDNGWFQLPDKSQAISDIFIKSTIKNNATSFSPSTVSVPSFLFTLNGEKIEGQVDVINQGSNQLFDGKIKGKVNLAALQDAYPMASIQQMEGSIDIDAKAKGSSAAIAANDLSRLTYSGFINGKDVNLHMDGQPKLSVKQFSSSLKNDQLVISNIDGKIGESDFKGSGNLAPISALMTDTELPVSISADLRGNKFNLNELMSSESPASETTNKEEINASPSELLRNLQMNINADYDQVVYEDYKLKQISTAINGSMQNMDIKKFDGIVNNSPVKASGNLRNIYGYTYEGQTLVGDLNVKTTKLNAADWMEEETGTTSTTTETAYAVIPERMDLKVKVEADQLQYEDIDVRQAKGNIVVQNQRVSIGDMTGRTLGGNFDVDGFYAYDGNGQPKFKLDYDLSQFSFEQTFKQVEMASFLLPIIKYIKGSFNTKMSLSGDLQEGYMPNLDKLDGSGLLETLHSSISNSNTLNKISSLLNIDALKNLEIERTFNRFRVENGALNVEPFNHEVEGILATISGSHKLTGDMSYTMRLNIPTEKFNKTGIPGEITKQFAAVQKSLNKFGIQLNEAKSINVDVLIQGSISDPKVSLKLVDFSKQSVQDAVKDAAKELIQTAKDSVKNEGTRKIINAVQGNSKDSTQTSVKDAIKVRAKEEVDKKIKEEVKPVTDTLKAKAEEAIKDKVGEELKDKLDEETKEKGEELIDKYNPFKKKKKEGG